MVGAADRARGSRLPPTWGWSETWPRYGNERTWTVVDALDAIAKETGKSAAQIALNWLLRRPGVTAPIIGARNLEQLDDNLGATGWALDAGSGGTPRPGERHAGFLIHTRRIPA